LDRVTTNALNATSGRFEDIEEFEIVQDKAVGAGVE
jgi:hypothetical protein